MLCDSIRQESSLNFFLIYIQEINTFSSLFLDKGKTIAIDAGFLVMKDTIEREHLDYPTKVQ